MTGENVGITSPVHTRTSLGREAWLGRGWPYLPGGGGLIYIAHWQFCLCTGHAGISSQLFYIMKICMLGKFQAQLQLICCTVFKLSRDSVGLSLCLPAGKGALAPVKAPFRGALPSAPVQQKQPTCPSDHPKEGTRGLPRNGPRTLSKRGGTPLINNKAKITSVATFDKDVTKKKPLFNLRNVEVKI